MRNYCKGCGAELASDSEYCFRCSEIKQGRPYNQMPPRQKYTQISQRQTYAKGGSEIKALRAIVALILILVAIFVIQQALNSYNSSHFEESNWEWESTTPSISFVKDDNNDYLQVTSVSQYGLSWSDITITGTATKPTGTISAGDKITNCYGTVRIYYKSTNLGSYTFT